MLNRHRYLTYLCGATVLAVAALGAAQVVNGASTGITRRAFDRIQGGMTVEQVEALLGAPGCECDELHKSGGIVYAYREWTRAPSAFRPSRTIQIDAGYDFGVGKPCVVGKRYEE